VKKPRTEKQVRDPVVVFAKKNGVLHERNHKGPGAATGFPDDRFYFAKGRCLMIEFKAEVSGAISARQKLIIDTLRDAGHDVEVHNNTDEAVRAITQRLDRFGRSVARRRSPDQ
jgi:hypothetical protein